MAPTTAIRTTKAGTIERTILLSLSSDHQDLIGVVTEVKQLKTGITRTTDSYRLRKLFSDFGKAYQVEKRYQNGETYQLLHDGHSLTCDCPAGTYRGTCRHIEMVSEATKKGLL